MVKGTVAFVVLPKLRAGGILVLDGLGTRFSGRYFVTKTIHSLSAARYTTKFECRLEEVFMAQPFADHGLILCTVIASDDPAGLGNVRVQHPASPDQPSTQTPVSQMMARGDAGTCVRPPPRY